MKTTKKQLHWEEGSKKAMAANQKTVVWRHLHAPELSCPVMFKPESTNRVLSGPETRAGDGITV
jgi:hypothetical protein